jgi:hypothetical protein
MTKMPTSGWLVIYYARPIVWAFLSVSSYRNCG